MLIAPADWQWFGFPLGEPDSEPVSIQEVVRIAHSLMDEGERTGDEAVFGAVPHWAHILKTAQGPDGAWPEKVNARTGEPIGKGRTLAPLSLMARLDALLDSTEYAVCREAAPLQTSQGEPDGT